ncbi:MAG: NAD-dependent deacetylase [Eikenella corrodens]|uniref:SIR2 family NAD-dependent protein deacylase n=1 Tax=Eikenella TaxID=538 RepID=UPI0007D07D85|nr:MULTISPECIES: NAD-dependent deacylase [Eikenella]MDU1346049.1 NAD-dependent deacylase [Eikenella corrodens]MDU4299359.1 NAD-dependent deacylase [Eikenella corrodens]OAM33582.1 NAD-dependent protein deacylase [Eikenella corrodens]OFN56534.1 NAD-dependent deacylase [Eikenella sp. HMSC061C02]
MQKIVVLTGAGISADSGLRTFRDTDGLWEGYKVEEVCTPEAFARNPQLVIDFYNERRRQAQAAEPNAAHRALAELEKYYQVQIITQNVDDLHERAGSSTVLHLHGELNKARSSADENYVVEWTGDQSINDTDPQGYPMRPHIVWFGEAVPLIETAARWVSQADKVLVVGTSMQVYPAAGLLEYAPYEAERYLVDPRPPKGLANISIIEAKAKDGVPQLVDKLITEAARH